MSKTVKVKLSRLKFPSTCVVCMSPASRSYEMLSTVRHTTRKRSYVKIHVPMCGQHFEAVSFKSTGEKLVGVLGIFGGIGAWIGTLAVLLWMTGQENLLTKAFVSFGASIVAWALIAGGLASRFAEPASLEARSAVRILNYAPRDDDLWLEFHNESFAEIMQRTT